LRHWGIYGLFPVAVLDSTPLPTFGGPDILAAILAARHGEPWYYYSTAAALGSVIGAYITFRIARGAGSAYLQKKFGKPRVEITLKYFERWGAGPLVLSTLIPFPFPTSAFFAAAGALNYPLPRFISAVALARAARYSVIAAIASHYGSHFIRVLRHPEQYIGWVVLIVCLIGGLIATAVLVHRWLRAAPE
jgi:membrane protein YqaA with SNARE-associated domain